MATDKKTPAKKEAGKKVTTATAPTEKLEMQSIHTDERTTAPEQLPVDEKHEARVAAQAENAVLVANADETNAKIFAAESAVEAPGSTAFRAREAVKSGTEYMAEGRPGDLVPDKTFAVGEPSTEEAKVDRYDIAKREADATASIFGANGVVQPGGYRGHGDKQDEWDRLEATRQEFRGKEDDAAIRALAKDGKVGENRRIDASTWYADEGGKLQSQGHSTRSILGKYYGDMTNDQEKNNKISDVMNSHQDLVKSGKVKELFDKL